jgi:hypothetical protein
MSYTQHISIKSPEGIECSLVHCSGNGYVKIHHFRPGTIGNYIGSNLNTRISFLVLNYVGYKQDLLCGLVVRVSGYRSRGPGAIPGPTRFSE